MSFKVAVVDDDRQLTTLITEYLIGRGYDAYGFTDYAAARKGINDSISLVLIDIHLGNSDGLVLMSELNRQYVAQKYIVFTGDDSLPKRLHSFAKGADDYMKKPIFPSELEARVRRLLCRDLQRGYCSTIDSRRYTKSEQRILEILIESKGEIVPLEVLSQATEVSECALYTSISRLRKKTKERYRIKTSYGRGWYLEVI